MDTRRADRGGAKTGRHVLRLIGLAAAGLAIPLLLHTLIPVESESSAAPPPPVLQNNPLYCPGCIGFYQGDLWDLHYHLPLAGCLAACNTCDLPGQQAFATDLNNETARLGVFHIALQGMANDNTVGFPIYGSYDCVIDKLRDTERGTVADAFPRMSPMLDSIDPTDSSEAQYVEDQFNTPGAPWMGVGEVHLRSNAYQLNIHADASSWVAICEKAAAAGVPVFIHWDPRFDIPGGPGSADFQQTILELWGSSRTHSSPTRPSRWSGSTSTTTGARVRTNAARSTHRRRAAPSTTSRPA